MPRPEKVQAVEEIRSRFDEARATFVTEYRGLTVGEQQQLRRSVKQAEGEYQVFKMSLARRAIEDMSLEGLTDLLVGPTALAFANTDPVPVAKVLRDFANDHDKLIIKGGILGGEILPPEKISRLADIEPRDVLLSKVAGGFKAPMSKLAGLLGAKMRDAASMFSQLLEKKEAEAPVIEPAAAAVPEPAAETEAAEPVAEEAPAEVAEPVGEVATEEAPAEVAEPTAETEDAAEVAEELAEPVAEVSAEEAPAEVAEPAAETEGAAEVAEEVTEPVAEVAAEEAPAVETPASDEDAPAETGVTDEPARAEKAAPEVEPVAEVVPVAEAPAAEAEAPADTEVTEKPAPKKKAAPKAKAEKSSAKAEAETVPADGSDDTAEEE